MKPQDAINALDQAVSHVQANREVHVQLQEAVQVIREALAPTEKGKKAEEGK